MTPPAADPWAFAPAARPGRRRTYGDLYVVGLSVLLFGYALFGRSFAYLGVPPVFVGEVMLAIGLGLALFTCRTSSLVPAPALWAVLALQAWVLVRTVPYIPEFGLDAPRDAMLAGYAAYALAVAALLIQRPRRLPEMLVRYRTLVLVLGGLGWLIYLVYSSYQEAVPTLPWAPEVHVIENKPGDIAVHMAAIAAFLVLGWRRSSPVLLVLVVVGTAAMMVGNRGGMVGYLLAMSTFAVLRPKSASFGRFGYVVLVLIALGSVVDTSRLQTNDGNRSLSVGQLWENAKSLVGKSDQAMLSNTTEWRKQWWNKIVGYTVFGEYRWTGRGFGINLARADGFNTDEEGSLRSPHSVHMTVLARSGLPGAALWALVHGLWWVSLLGAWWYARERRLEAWMGFFALCAVYWVAAVVNASFDVYLEGPMGAIWFWTVFGAAMAGTRLVRTDPTLLDGMRQSDAPPAPARPQTWNGSDEVPRPARSAAHGTPARASWAWGEVPTGLPAYAWPPGPVTPEVGPAHSRP